jgi:alkanesulfonate monooxygenase
MIPIYTTCPPSSTFEGKDYLPHVGRVARWSEEGGATGMLIYTDNSLVDPWCVAQAVLTETERLLPLIAVQPVYAPPFSIAKRIASLAHLYHRAIALNMVAGGFVKDLAALGDATAHDDRYERLLEYTQMIKALLRNESVTFEGRYFNLTDARLSPSVPEPLLPRIFVSGSSEAGANVAASLDATAVNYPPAPEALLGPVAPGTFARVGIIAAETDAAAWAAAHLRFPPSRRGEMTHRLATAVSDSVWHKTLSEMAKNQSGADGPYWLHPLKTYRTFCPYLVGSHETVGATLARYREAGFVGFILDVPQSQHDLAQAMEAFRHSDRHLAAADKHHETVAAGPATL